MRDLEAPATLLGLIEDDTEAEATFLDWLIGDVNVCAGELAAAMIARARRRQP